ncbi:hypothetical protein CF326_g5775 [Tilletia indica]|nr:hypothetical protein CF326_g5775 [Tilletia indica]
MPPKSDKGPAASTSSAAADETLSTSATLSQPSMADIFNAIRAISERVDSFADRLEAIESETAAQKGQLTEFILKNLGKGTVEPMFKSPTSPFAADNKDRVTQSVTRQFGQGTQSPSFGLQLGPEGGPFGLTPPHGLAQPHAETRAKNRPSMGVSGFPLPPQANSAAQRRAAPSGATAQTTRFTLPPHRSVPRDSDPAMVAAKADLMTAHQEYVRSIHSSWTDAQIDEEATRRAAEDYLGIRKRAIEDALSGTPAKTIGAHSFEPGRPFRKINWDMVKIMAKLSWTNWSDWRSSMYSLLGTVPGAIGILEGTIYGPRYLSPEDLSSHPDYDEALDLELGQVIQSSTEMDVKSLLLKPTSEQELRGSVFYRELRTWLVPNQGYSALKLIARMGRHRQREEESVRQFGERLRKFNLELQSAGETIDQNKQVGFLLAGLRSRFHAARDGIVSRQAAGEQFNFEKALRILAETEESFGAFEDRRRPVQTRSVPPLS